VPLLNAPAGNVENRVAHIKSHFLNRLFLRLNGTRVRPILAPPFPAAYQLVDGFDPSVAFVGLHPDVYSLSNDAFQVAKRFWIARAYTLFQLGSAQSWSSHAAGSGLLGPDLAQWPPVVHCEMITNDIFLVVTRASPPTSTSTDDHDVSYLVLGATGDILGHSRAVNGNSAAAESRASSSTSTNELQFRGCSLRPDWHAFLTAAASSPSLSESIMSSVETKDHTDFPSGINKSWAARSSQIAQGQGDELLRIAERAVLTSCLLNRLAPPVFSILFPLFSASSPCVSHSRFGVLGILRASAPLHFPQRATCSLTPLQL
jgi:hypothetical protein